MQPAKRLWLVFAIGGTSVSSYLGCGADEVAPATFPGHEAGADAPRDEGASPDAPSNPDLDDSARTLYPTLEALYQGNQGIYRTCGPNNGVCHNDKQFPNLASVGSVVENIDLPCNVLRDKPGEIHNLCERRGDFLQLDHGDAGAAADAGDARRIEIGYVEDIEPDAGMPVLPRHWRMVLKETPPDDVSTFRATIVRGPQDEVHPVTGVGVSLTVDPEKRNAVRIDIDIEIPDDGGFPPGAFLAVWLMRAGTPNDRTAMQLGDPNRDGTFGATLGGRLVKPGDPAKSYLLTRLTDPKAGPLMPLANCCHWSAASARALWCWVASLDPQGTNALDAIDYAKCPPGPPDTVVYAGQGPNCETSGLCPTRAKGVLTADPTWSNIHPNIIQANCASCHSGGAAAAAQLDMGTSDGAWTALIERGLVVPHDAAGSLLYRKIDPATCGPLSCMPKSTSSASFQPLEERARLLIKRWIDDGASK
ncbi:hypothetical protein LVJ94_25100 [Pendulispora rubella]|uniref:Cytochrome c domain-containing protein n=1 Tax=Pendulispora rubella TaxID=2741070 RepID=A0ABZ2LHR9_9BACT